MTDTLPRHSVSAHLKTIASLFGIIGLVCVVIKFPVILLLVVPIVLSLIAITLVYWLFYDTFIRSEKNKVRAARPQKKKPCQETKTDERLRPLDG